MISVYDDLLTAAEWRRIQDVPTSAEAQGEALDLIAWFCARYPTPVQRLAYVHARMKVHRRGGER
jgi:hypothetical protein